MELSDSTLTLAGILLLSVITIESGGVFLLRVVQGRQPATDLQRSFFRAGHAHAGMFVTLGLVIQPFVDAADLGGVAGWIARAGIPVAAILVPAGFFLSVAHRDATAPNRLMWLLRAGVVLLTAGAATLGVALLAS